MAVLSLLHDNWWAVALLGVIAYLGNKIRVYRRLSAFKGPFSTGFSDLWHTRAMMSLNPDLYHGVCDKYGSIARVGPNDLLTCSPELLLHMSSARSPYTRGKWYYIATRFEKGKDHVFSMLDEGEHTTRRNQMGMGYSGKENLALEGSIDKCITEFIDLIRSKYLSTPAQSKPFDLAIKLKYLTLDIISLISYGEAFGDLQTDSDVNSYIQAAGVGLFMNTMAMAFGLTKIFQSRLVTRFLAPSEKDAIGMGKVLSSARNIIEARFKRGNMDEKSDMIASFARHGMTMEQIIGESNLQIVAGSDTSAAALATIMLYLFTHPPVYAKLQAEVDSAVKNIGISDEQVVQDAQARNLPYLQAVIKESMRVHPPVAVQAPKRVPDGGDTVVIDGKEVFLPGGTNISCAVFPLHLRKDIFGQDADAFRPERWILEKDKTKLATMNQIYDLTFGYGKYQCLGKPVASMEINKITFELIRNFDWCLANPGTPWKELNLAGVIVHEDMFAFATDRK